MATEQTPISHEGIIPTPNLFEKIDATLFGVAMTETNEDTFIRLRRAAQGLITSAEKIHTDFQEQHATFDEVYPEEVASMIVRMPVSLPTQATEALLKETGALGEEDDLSKLRRDASKIGSHGFWVMEGLQTTNLGGAQMSLCGLTGGQYGYFDIAVIIPRETLRSAVNTPTPPSQFDKLKYYKKPPMGMEERFGIIYNEQATRYAEAQDGNR